MNDSLVFEDSGLNFRSNEDLINYVLLNTNWDTGNVLWYFDNVEVWDGEPDAVSIPEAKALLLQAEEPQQTPSFTALDAGLRPDAPPPEPPNPQISAGGIMVLN